MPWSMANARGYIEVPAAMNLDEIWRLVNTSERTRKHCMQLENCVYDFFEMNTLNMAQAGLFGDIMHVEGSYIHNLKEFWPYYWKIGVWHITRQTAVMLSYTRYGLGLSVAGYTPRRPHNIAGGNGHQGCRATDYIEATTGIRPEVFANGDIRCR